MFLVTVLVENIAAKRQKLFNDILPLRVWHRNTTVP